MISFEFNGRKSTGFGIYLAERPELRAPEADSTVVKVPGRGELTIVNGGWRDIRIDLEAYIQDVRRLPEALAWLTAEGGFRKLSLSYDPGRYRMARIDGEITAEHVTRGLAARRLSIPLRMKPYIYAAGDIELTMDGAGTLNVYNPGSIEALPVVEIAGGGEITFTAGGKTLTVADISEFASAVRFDSDAKLAWYTQTSDDSEHVATGYTSGEWPVIPPGSSAITVTGSGVTGVTIAPRWRWLG